MSKRTAETPFDQLVNRAIDQGQKSMPRSKKYEMQSKSMVALNKEGELSDISPREKATMI